MPGIGGPLESASAYFMKSPAKQYPDTVARELLEQFIRDTASVDRAGFDAASEQARSYRPKGAGGFDVGLARSRLRHYELQHEGRPHLA